MLPNVVENHDVDDRFPHMNKSPDDDAQSGDKSHFPIVVVCQHLVEHLVLSVAQIPEVYSINFILNAKITYTTTSTHT